MEKMVGIAQQFVTKGVSETLEQWCHEKYK